MQVESFTRDSKIPQVFPPTTLFKPEMANASERKVEQDTKTQTILPLSVETTLKTKKTPKMTTTHTAKKNYIEEMQI